MGQKQLFRAILVFFFLALLPNFNPVFADPCAKVGSSYQCDTAIGPINTDPVQFLKTLFAVILSLSGGIALLLIIFSGYRLMTSQGNAEAIQGARDTIISAITGLLFIIFSLVIMQIIGIDILGIPQFK